MLRWIKASQEFAGFSLQRDYQQIASVIQ